MHRSETMASSAIQSLSSSDLPHCQSLQPQSDLDVLRKDEEYLGNMVKEYEQKLSVELMLKSSAQAMARIHSDKKSRRKAEDEIQFAYRRIELISGELVKLVSRFRLASQSLRQAEVQAVHDSIAESSDPSLPVKPALLQSSTESSLTGDRSLKPIVSESMLGSRVQSIQGTEMAVGQALRSSPDLTPQQNASSQGQKSSEKSHTAGLAIVVSNEASEQLDSKNKEIQELKRQLETTKSRIGKDHSGTLSDPSPTAAANAHLLEENAALQESLSALSKSSSDIVSELNTALASYRHEKLSLEDQLRSTESHFFATRRQFVQANYEVQALRLQLVERGVDENKLTLIQDLANATSVSDTACLQLQKITSDRDAAVTSFQTLLARQESYSAGVTSWKKALAADLQHKLTGVETALAVSRANENQKCQEYEARITLLTSECEAIKSANEQLCTAHAQAIAELDKTICRQREELSLLQAEKVNKDEHIDLLSTHLTTARFELGQAKQASELLEIGTQHQNDLAEQLNKAELDIKDLTTTVALLEADKLDHIQAIATLEARKGDIQDQFDSMLLQKNDLEQQVSQMTHSLLEAHANEETSVYTARQVQIQKDVETSQLQETMDQMLLDIRTLRLKERNASDQQASLREELQESRDQVKAANDVHEHVVIDYEARMAELSEVVLGLRDENNALRGKSDLLTRRCHDSDTAHVALLELYQAKQVECADKMAKHDHVSNQLEMANDRALNLESAQSVAAEEKAATYSSLQEAMATIQTLKAHEDDLVKTHSAACLRIQEIDDDKAKLIATHDLTCKMLEQIQIQHERAETLIHNLEAEKSQCHLDSVHYKAERDESMQKAASLEADRERIQSALDIQTQLTIQHMARADTLESLHLSLVSDCNDLTAKLCESEKCVARMRETECHAAATTTPPALPVVQRVILEGPVLGQSASSGSPTRPSPDPALLVSALADVTTLKPSRNVADASQKGSHVFQEHRAENHASAMTHHPDRQQPQPQPQLNSCPIVPISRTSAVTTPPSTVLVPLAHLDLSSHTDEVQESKQRLGQDLYGKAALQAEVNDHLTSMMALPVADEATPSKEVLTVTPSISVKAHVASLDAAAKNERNEGFRRHDIGLENSVNTVIESGHLQLNSPLSIESNEAVQCDMGVDCIDQLPHSMNLLARNPAAWHHSPHDKATFLEIPHQPLSTLVAVHTTEQESVHSMPAEVRALNTLLELNGACMDMSRDELVCHIDAMERLLGDRWMVKQAESSPLEAGEGTNQLSWWSLQLQHARLVMDRYTLLSQCNDLEIRIAELEIRPCGSCDSLRDELKEACDACDRTRMALRASREHAAMLSSDLARLESATATAVMLSESKMTLERDLAACSAAPPSGSLAKHSQGESARHSTGGYPSALGGGGGGGGVFRKTESSDSLWITPSSSLSKSDSETTFIDLAGVGRPYTTHIPLETLLLQAKSELADLKQQIVALTADLGQKTMEMDAARRQAWADQQAKRDMFKALQDLQKATWM
ncbi:hypothetical protein BSLG_000671 [Batrachochytrium salamandrivorans]|nr:hypothetical protein BSLG_000671 [Batrachochytrium salamandrivorans]